MGHGTVSTLVLHRVDAARNMAGFTAASSSNSSILYRPHVPIRPHCARATGRRTASFLSTSRAETAMARLAGIKSGRGYLRVPDDLY
jgi:predicted DNA-binding WGR domain protein